VPANLYIKTIHYGVQKNSHMGFDSRTGPKLVIPRARCQKQKSLILSPDAKNDFNHKPKYSKLFLPKANILKNILTLSPNAQAKTCLGLCLNCVA